MNEEHLKAFAQNVEKYRTSNEQVDLLCAKCRGFYGPDIMMINRCACEKPTPAEPTKTRTYELVYDEPLTNKPEPAHLNRQQRRAARSQARKKAR